jgi:chemotaxis protein MotB
LLALPKDAVFQVGGHTDNQPIKSEEVKARFPTNWELSAARATNVVRFLEETAGIPGKRLVAAGFSEFRPMASNKKEKTRAQNRRIEIALLPPAK